MASKTPFFAEPVAFDDVARLSPWPAILTGTRSFARRQRTVAEVQREYGLEKWGEVLARLKQPGPVEFTDLLRWQGINPARRILFSEGTAFFLGGADAVFDRYLTLMGQVLRRYRRPTLVELGSGIGDKLLGFARTLGSRTALGGEFTQSGVECGRILSRKWQVPAAFRRFDFNEPRTVAFVPRASLVYTAHAVEQIPQVRPEFIEALCRRGPKYVAHFEPCHEDRPANSLLGLLRRRYAEVNDYNRNLVGLLRDFEARGRLRILEHRRDVFGVSPFNSTSVLVWTPANT